MNQLIHKETAFHLGIFKDNDGFYHAPENKKISIAKHTEIICSFEVSIKLIYENKLKEFKENYKHNTLI